MKAKMKDDRYVFSIRVPPALHEKLLERAENIGIAKSAVILNLLYQEFLEGKDDKQQVKQ